MLLLSHISDRPACAGQNHWRQWISPYVARRRGEWLFSKPVIGPNDAHSHRRWRGQGSSLPPLVVGGHGFLIDNRLKDTNWLHVKLDCGRCKNILLPVATAIGKGAQRSKRLRRTCCRSIVHWTHHSSGKQMISFFAWLSQDSCLLPFRMISSTVTFPVTAQFILKGKQRAKELFRWSSISAPVALKVCGNCELPRDAGGGQLCLWRMTNVNLLVT